MTSVTDQYRPPVTRLAGPISVCIAAYNEELPIGGLLSQLSAVQNSGLQEILVCANGCTDGTEEVVARHVRNDPRVRLLRSVKGKPAAWNCLMREARYDLRLFLDADVELSQEFFPALHETLCDQPRATVLAARDLPKRRRGGADALLAWLASRAFGFDYLCGRAYVIRASLLGQLTQPAPQINMGLPAMPLDVLAEDFWLEVIVGRSCMAFSPAARVYYDPGSVADLIKARARALLAQRQIALTLPNEFEVWRRDTARSNGSVALLIQRLGTLQGISDFLACSISAVCRVAVMAIRKHQLQQVLSTMVSQMESMGGQAVLSDSGRVSRRESPFASTS